ncbi:MAG: arginine--tRNA ligase [Microgenomates group bacterium]|nr:arginine--tRNA ligase [Microgenomates group bacterium]
MVKNKIIENLVEALKKTGIKENLIPKLEQPANPSFGDYASNIALVLSQKIKKNALDIAYEILKNIKKNDLIEKTEVVKPGFINFWLTKNYLIEAANEFINDQWLNQNFHKKKNILLEFGQPNTHKIPHIGHFFSYIYGEALARIFEAAGNKVFRINYQGDVGLHVAKCLYEVKNQLEVNKTKTEDLKTLKEKVDFLQRCYQKGAKKYEEDPTIKEKIDQLNIKIYQKDKEIYKLWEKTRQWSLDFYQDFEKKLGIKYDRYYFESETSTLGKEIVLKNLGKIFIKSQKAIIFPGEKYHLHNRVFINQYGNPTYEAKDIGLITQKMKDFELDQSLVATASEQNEYWRIIIKVSEMLYPKLVGKLKHIGFGMINLTSGKMSSRTGNILDPFTLIETIKTSIEKSFQIKNKDLVEKIALAAIKYSFLNSDYKKNIVFDLEKSISKEGNSGPYLLYTYVRTQSVIKKFLPPENNFWVNLKEKLIANNRMGLEKDERELLRFFNQYPEIIQKAVDKYNPSLIANYLYVLAKKYNLFYQNYPILKAEQTIKNLRLLITKTTGKIIKKGLYLLGIETVEEM